MLSTGRSSPFPSTGGSVPHGSPARRQFQQNEVTAMQKSTQLEGPPGPSSETILTGLPQLRQSTMNGTLSSASGAPLRTASRNGAGTPTMMMASPSQLMEMQAASRVAPARVRASPDLGYAGGMATTGGAAAAGGRPPSAPQYGRRSGSAMGGSSSSSTANQQQGGNTSKLTAFEEEIFAIGRLNKVLPERANDSRSSSNMGGGVIGGGKRAPSPSNNMTSGAGGGLLSTSRAMAGSRLSSSGDNTNTATSANPWSTASVAGKKGTQRNAPLRAIQPSPTFGDHDATTELIIGGPIPTLSDDQLDGYINGSIAAGGGGNNNTTFFSGGRSTATPSSAMGGNNTTVYDGTSSSATNNTTFYQGNAPAGEDEEHPNRTATNKPIHVPYAPDIRPQIGGMQTQQPRQPLVLRDYQMIAEACQRASRVRIEGAAYYKIGELLAKNKRDTLHKSVAYFKKYLNISRRLQDVQGECKALNVLGCTYYSLQHHTKEMGGRSREELIATALEYHQEHSNIADAAGLFIAQSNMGLCFRALGELERAAECYKTAMQYAVRSGDRVAEALALANLSDVGTLQGDVQTAQVCVERNLEIAAATKDSRVGCESYEQLGSLAMLKGDYAAATESYLMGLEVALTEGDNDKAAELRCKIGLVQGKMRMQEQMAQAVKRMTTPGM